MQSEADGRREVALSGSSGLIGSALAGCLAEQGVRVRRLVRGRPNVEAGELPLPGVSPEVGPAAFEGLDAVVHLAGENIAAGRWTAARRRRLVESRVEPTRQLCTLLARLDRPPKVVVCASAIGFYGDRGDELLDEESAPGGGFLADTCRQWEAAAALAREGGIRVVSARFGVVLSASGGALAAMVRPFRLGLGGPLGGGRQWWSWISLDDAARAVLHALATEQLDGPVNVVSPEPVTNREFTRMLARTLHRPAVFRAPRLALRTLLGAMADEMLLSSARVVPGRLEATGFAFRQPTLKDALRDLLGDAG